MRNRYMKIPLLFFMTANFCTCCNINAFAVTSDLDYQFKTENKEEFYITGESHIHFDGAVPDYLLDIYDLAPQKRHDSEYGATIITPSEQKPNVTTYAPANAPSGKFTQSPNGFVTGATQGTQQSGSTTNLANTAKTQGVTQQNNQNNITGNFYPSTSTNLPSGNTSNAVYYANNEEQKLQYPLTTIEQVRKSDGSIGTLKIPSVKLTVTAYDGDTYVAMKKGIGHISSTSTWNGNAGFVGHNRGSSGYFQKLKNVSEGDEITYTTILGTRNYIVQSVSRISETDWTKLEYTNDNRLTLITCVEDVPNQRLCVQAVEKR